jgi:hypothetical protein
MWLKIKVWTKIVVFVLVMTYVGAFLIFNHGEEVNIWIWVGTIKRPDVLTLIAYTLIAGIVGTLLFRMVFRTLRQLREISQKKKQSQLHEDVNDLKSKAGMLQTKPTPPPTVIQQ